LPHNSSAQTHTNENRGSLFICSFWAETPLFSIFGPPHVPLLRNLSPYEVSPLLPSSSPQSPPHFSGRRQPYQAFPRPPAVFPLSRATLNARLWLFPPPPCLNTMVFLNIPSPLSLYETPFFHPPLFVPHQCPFSFSFLPLLPSSLLKLFCLVALSALLLFPL